MLSNFIFMHLRENNLINKDTICAFHLFIRVIELVRYSKFSNQP
ncbi:hypothetical protein THF1C08_10419 [Vibrio jasicida]|uniref:Uncharacterized protein n=1 Tax=Vibrio jasicida TaxID=766224 RepID=A0AAU9QG54_9VIBR|nr:hypothetical protein THF1C08_10419 [Vibrio jasicida]CAH1565854.1 hypothetical protein THF1A12_10420 [Vibrio jasicida]